MDSISCFGALDGLFACVRRRGNLCPNQHSPLLHCGHVLLHMLVFRHKDGVPSRFPALDHGHSPHLWPQQICCGILYRTEVRRETLLSCRRTNTSLVSSAVLKLLLKDMTRVNECRKMEEKQLQGEICLIYEPPLLLQRKYIPSCKKRRGGVKAAAEDSWSAGESSAAIEIMRTAPAVLNLSHTF